MFDCSDVYSSDATILDHVHDHSVIPSSQNYLYNHTIWMSNINQQCEKKT